MLTEQGKEAALKGLQERRDINVPRLSS